MRKNSNKANKNANLENSGAKIQYLKSNKSVFKDFFDK